MSKRVSKTLYSKIPSKELLELSMLSSRLDEMFKEAGISVPALKHHISGIDQEIRQRVALSKKEAPYNVKA